MAVSFPPSLHPPEPVLPTLTAAGCVLRPPLEETKSVTWQMQQEHSDHLAAPETGAIR